ncbi:MAG: hypothetical protein ACKO0M_05540 [Cyanobium sp.]
MPVLVVCAILAPILPGRAATRIRFASGSYCGSYSGNFSGGREFVLGLSAGQTLTSRNTGQAAQYDISVFGPAGGVLGRKASRSTLQYSIPVTGDYYITVRSTSSCNSVEFCAC